MADNFVSVYNSATAADFNTSSALPIAGFSLINANGSAANTGSGLLTITNITGSNFLIASVQRPEVALRQRIVAFFAGAGMATIAGNTNARPYLTLRDDGTQRYYATVYLNGYAEIGALTATGTQTILLQDGMSGALDTTHNFSLDFSVRPGRANTSDLIAILRDETTNAVLWTATRLQDAFGPQGAGKAGLFGIPVGTGTFGFTQIQTFVDTAAAPTFTPTTGGVACFGDSETYGLGVISNDIYRITGEPYPALLQADLPNATLFNFGYVGQTSNGTVPDVATTVAPVLNSGGYNVKIATYLMGINDVLNTSQTVQQIAADIVAWHTEAKAKGLFSIAMTVPRTLATGNSSRNGQQASDATDQVSALLRSQANPPWSTLVELNSNAAFTNPANTTYYQSDTLHFTAAGDAVIKSLLKPAILALFPQPDPYQSDNATPVQILADYKPSAPNPLVATGLGTVLLPTAVLTCPAQTDLNGGRLVFLRRLPNSNAAFVIVGMTTGIDANTPPTPTFTDTTVKNGVRYEYTAYALPIGDF